MTKKDTVLIKIGNQSEANKDIFLHENGHVSCGRYEYKGSSIKIFKDIYEEIIERAGKKPINNVIDVSMYKTWDAVTIYDEYIVNHWVKAITSKTIEKMANETIICRLVNTIKPEFTLAVRKAWKKIFLAWKDKDDPNTPRNPWQIF